MKNNIEIAEKSLVTLEKSGLSVDEKRAALKVALEIQSVEDDMAIPLL